MVSEAERMRRSSEKRAAEAAKQRKRAESKHGKGGDTNHNVVVASRWPKPVIAGVGALAVVGMGTVGFFAYRGVQEDRQDGALQSLVANTNLCQESEQLANLASAEGCETKVVSALPFINSNGDGFVSDAVINVINARRTSIQGLRDDDQSAVLKVIARAEPTASYGETYQATGTDGTNGTNAEEVTLSGIYDGLHKRYAETSGATADLFYQSCMEDMAGIVNNVRQNAALHARSNEMGEINAGDIERSHVVLDPHDFAPYTDNTGALRPPMTTGPHIEIQIYDGEEDNDSQLLCPYPKRD